MSSATTPQRNIRRPAGVTLLVILGYLNGIFTILTGIAVIVDRDEPELVVKAGMSPDQLLWLGIAAIWFGLIVMLIAATLGRGSEIIRILYAVVAVLNAGVGVYALVALEGEQQLAGAISVAFALLILYLLFNHRTEAWFEAQSDR
ncbi:MAG TPA: hypothetical protein VJM33_11070 [Microthrixaceae bacterium]|nr:hypothetical protein [Microthrixaceae bacterium]